MSLNIIGFTLEVIGKVLLGVTVLIVYLHVLKEHRIDADVLRQMRKEQILGILAVILLFYLNKYRSYALEVRNG